MTPSELKSLIGQEVGLSRWLQVTQDRINAFAEITEDEQFIHVDPARAAQTPFGGTIAHGFLTLSLGSAMVMDALPPIEGTAMGINYGFDSLRFLAPVPSGSRVRGRFTLISVEEKDPNRLLIKYGLSVEIEHQTKPAMVAEWLTLQVLEA